jgi:predicted nucleotidyltransferase/uncharacterized protein (UPF0332 family)
MASKQIVRKAQPATFSAKSERDLAMDFASSVHKRFESLIKATVLFGSQAKHTATPSSDIDIIIVVDDASVQWDLELIAWYREELAKLVSAHQSSRELHVNTVKLTTWWQDLMNGDPVVLNMIRYGEPLIDIGGFFKPIKSLLIQGKIHATPEAVYMALQRSPSHLSRSKAAQLSAVEGVYWCMVDAAQAALMTAGMLPPSPEHIPLLLKETFADKNIIKQELVSWYRDIYGIHKAIAHGQVTHVKGADIDNWQVRAETFLRSMTSIIDHLIEAKKQ